jgi:hypothetical protein
MSEVYDLETSAEAPEESGLVIDFGTTVDPLLSQWARFRDLFKASMEGGFWTIEDLEQKIAHRRAFFFPGQSAAMVGEVVVFPGSAKVLQVTWAAGDVEELLRMAPGVEAVARMMGCNGMLIEGRPAWVRVLKPMGYEHWSSTAYKAL